MNENNINERLQTAMDAAQVAWWEMDYPSGTVRFGSMKTDMLGYDEKDFTHYKHFTDLVDPADYEPMMQAMREHLEGRKEVYETIYRIKASNGSYFTFYDRGKITNRDENGITLSGIVSNVSTFTNFAQNIADNYKSIQD